MRRRPLRFVASAVFAATLACSRALPDGWAPREGDVLFQSLPRSPLVDAIEGASRSPWSHCGLVARRGDDFVVVEAFGTVRETPLEAWIARGRGGGFAVHRWTDALAPAIPALVAAARDHLGRPYDFRYAFGNDAIYCSELVFLAFEAATGRRLAGVQTLGALEWKPFEAVIRDLEGGPPPLDRELFTPAALAAAPELPLLLAHGVAPHVPATK